MSILLALEVTPTARLSAVDVITDGIAATEKVEEAARGDIWKEWREKLSACYMLQSRMPRTSVTVVRSARKGTKSTSSVSCGSLNHEETGTAFFG